MVHLQMLSKKLETQLKEEQRTNDQLKQQLKLVTSEITKVQEDKQNMFKHITEKVWKQMMFLMSLN